MSGGTIAPASFPPRPSFLTLFFALLFPPPVHHPAENYQQKRHYNPKRPSAKLQLDLLPAGEFLLNWIWHADAVCVTDIERVVTKLVNEQVAVLLDKYRVSPFAYIYAIVPVYAVVLKLVDVDGIRYRPAFQWHTPARTYC